MIRENSLTVKFFSAMLGKEISIKVKPVSFNSNIKMVEDPHVIIHLLSIGIDIPILLEFEPYIIFDLKHFTSKSLILIEGEQIIGHVLVYHHEPKTLFFGFFGVLIDLNRNIPLLIDALIKYGQQNDFKYLKGPINIPTIIYGWGFMDKNSSTSPFIHKPVTPSEYLDCFHNKEFTDFLVEYSYEGHFKPFPEELIKDFDFSEYEVFKPETWDEILATKVEFLLLNARNLPTKSVVTPDTVGIFNNYYAFIRKYGGPYLFVYARHKPTNKLVGCFAATPNPLQKDEKGNYNSIVLLTVVLDKDHRNKGIGWLLTKAISDQVLKHGLSYVTTFIGSHVNATKKMAEDLGFELLRTHYVLTYKL